MTDPSNERPEAPLSWFEEGDAELSSPLDMSDWSDASIRAYIIGAIVGCAILFAIPILLYVVIALKVMGRLPAQ